MDNMFNQIGLQESALVLQLIENERKKVTALPSSEDKEVALKALDIAGSKLGTVGPQLSLEDFSIVGVIARGSFGVVWQATHKQFGTVALKQQRADLDSLTEIWKERDILVGLKSRRICNILATFLDVDVFFVLEICHGSVAVLRKRISDSDENCVRFTIQLLQGLAHLHRQDIVHADIKPDNLLINSKNNLVISDFGSAIVLKGTQSVQLTETVGSLGYLDLNAMQDFIYSKSTDIFGAACVIFEMSANGFLLRYAGDDIKHSRDMYISALRDGRWCQSLSGLDGTSRETLMTRAHKCKYHDVLKKMISNDSSARSTAEELTQLPDLMKLLYDTGLGWEDLDNFPEKIANDFMFHDEEFESLQEGELSDVQSTAFQFMCYIETPEDAKRAAGAPKRRHKRPTCDLLD